MKRTALHRGGCLRRRGKRTKRTGGHLFERGRDPAYLAYVRTFPCLVCLKLGELQRTKTEACHVRSRGAGGNDVGNTVPMCRKHHDQQHMLGMVSFQRRYGVTLRVAAAALATQYEAAA